MKTAESRPCKPVQKPQIRPKSRKLPENRLLQGNGLGDSNSISHMQGYHGEIMETLCGVPAIYIDIRHTQR